MANSHGATAFWWTRKRHGKTERIPAVDYIDELGRSRRLTFDTMGEARKCAEEKRAQLRRRDLGLEIPKVHCDKTLAELCEWWLNKCCKPRSKSREECRLRVQVKLERDGATARHIGALPAAAITGQILEEHFDRLQQEGLEGSSINKLRQTLRTIYNKARKRSVWRGANPVLDTEPRPERAINYFVLDVKQLNPVLAHVAADWRNLFATAMLLGMR